MTIHSRITGTSPVPATMNPMAVDLTFQGTPFGKLELPEVQTSSGGTDVNIFHQDIKIINMETFKAFVKSLMKDQGLVLTLDNGQCTFRSFGMTSKCAYKKDILLKGRNRAKSEIIETDATTNTVRMHYKGPLEAEHGVSMFEVRDGAGGVIADLKAHLKIKQGHFSVKVHMKIKQGHFSVKVHMTRHGGKPIGSDAALVGVGAENPAWTNETLKYINTPLKLTETSCSLCP